MPDASSSSTNPSTWSQLALFASAAMGADVAAAIELRRSGHDPANQEEHLRARASLGQNIADFRETLVRLGINLVAQEQHPGVSSTGLIGKFHTLLMLRTGARHLHRIHQRLLSLYPGVDDTLIEKTRVLEGDFRTATVQLFGDRLLAMIDSGWEVLERAQVYVSETDKGS